ncbi:class I SAM-dependent methyltransferase [Evansella tamaricis]|uniref:Methyltransferase domain-containing protein n=1 Tax=Evansella tamaricis TaxID=2069301 RepID=A0ABS6JJJ9_9BACI|nr:class I SAM-dependent methyltransferase [Evansella tamaricis]MBU9713845.1 methyltransferase domain-containing protein [Evansella tamaricis]
MSDYMDMLAAYGVTEARPGGRKMTKKLLSLYPLPTNSNILEIGCGLGDTAKLLSEVKNTNVLAMDNHSKMIKKAKERHLNINNITWKIDDVNDANIREQSFDVIVSESVLSFTDLKKSLSNIYRWLKPNGLVYLLEPVYLGGLNNKELRDYKNFYGFHSLLKEGEWIHLFQQQGFSLMDTVKDEGEIMEDVEHSKHFPELVIDQQIDEKYIKLMENHLYFTENYLAFFDYAYFVLQK